MPEILTLMIVTAAILGVGATVIREMEKKKSQGQR